ncbi:hypothetical protein [Sinorhizobium sp. NFACC03]|uniref:hypothetical protein n=1 Tax=Sinorhizobium sp. NFACC03 TaxID=1566295 RepID=UPI00088FDB80|nr:hypothetical protein [Sinorhizobium sp. NFACC03]SDA39133.1 hypothetical protein SAMN03159448_00156 [Sinorhizobium sp. NFACC03]
MYEPFCNPQKEVATRWCPTVWLDEVAGILVADPADCVHTDGSGGWLLLDEDAEKDRSDGNSLPVTPGQVVSFCAHRTYGYFELIVNDDRTFECDPYPDDATHFAHADECDCETMFYSVAELVEQGDPDALGTAPLPAGLHLINIWHWSDEIAFRFEVEDGKPKFVRCAGAN